MQDRACIPSRYRGTRIGDFKTDIYSNISHARVMCKSINTWLANIEDNIRNGEGLYLYSASCGSGKTLMGYTLLNEAMIRLRISGLFASTVTTMSEISGSWDYESEVSESSILDKMSKVRLLVLDDFGAETYREWVGQRFYQIINERYDRNRTTIFTSNKLPNELEYDERIIDRIIERNILVPFPEESIRRKIADERNDRILKKMQKGQGS